MESTRKTRTLQAYASKLLQYPRWIIEREVDFTDCRYDGHYNAYLPECVNCQFSHGCRWLDQQRAPDIGAAPLDELIKSLGDAVEYLKSPKRRQDIDDDDLRAWMREARRFLRSHPE
jgi:hypothetical protein